MWNKPLITLVRVIWQDISLSGFIFTRLWLVKPPKRGKQFFSVSPGKALWVDLWQKMDRHQLALAYDAVVSSGEL